MCIRDRTEVPLLVRRTDASGIVAEFSNSSGYGVYIGQNGATGEGYIRTATGQPLVFTTNAGSGIANARLRIGSSGETTLFRLNTFPNPNNTGSEILGSKLVFGSNISLEERYPNGAYVDRQDLVLRTNTGYGQGLSDKIRFTSGAAINFEVSGEVLTSLLLVIVLAIKVQVNYSTIMKRAHGHQHLEQVIILLLVQPL